MCQGMPKLRAYTRRHVSNGFIALKIDVKLTLRISIMVAKASYLPSSPKIPPHNVLHHK